MQKNLLRACEAASQELAAAVSRKQIQAGSLFVEQADCRIASNFGLAKDNHASFLLGSITKPIAICAVMTLFEEEQFDLDDRLTRYLPEFAPSDFGSVTIRHLLTHTSGLPDQLPNNSALRSSNAPLRSFVEGCRSLAFSFPPGSGYEYSSMGILLACAVAERIATEPIASLVQRKVFDPLKMWDSALGIGRLSKANCMPVQTEFGAPEAGGGAADAARWDWNSSYWRSLGAPWGGAHASATDVGIFLRAMISNEDDFLRSSTKKLMLTNQNPAGLESRGLGFDVDMRSSKISCSKNSFGHSGSTGTLAWVDLDQKLICVVLTTLPARALEELVHPRHLASECIAKALPAKP